MLKSKFDQLKKTSNLLITVKNKFMKIIDIRRNTKIEKRYSIEMGELTTKVTYVKKYFLGFPFETLHKYRETYYGEVKSCDDCMLFL
ncbi:MAG: hypothetical protein ACI83B_000251 [Sediminicola sp.]|jgi:hypothetical protein|tara:strand:+ start:548 stop:808 length:261 start_codon:yes stop_codon:yes gene_type:complete